MLRYIVLSLILISTLTTYAQRYKYKELVPLMDSSTQGEQMALLWEYIAEETNHPNATWRLAKLHYDIFRKADPLLEFSKAMAHARESSLRLLSVKALVTASEVRSNNEYYTKYFNTVDSKGRPYVEFPIVQNKIAVMYDSTQQFQVKMPAIYAAFTKSVNQYDKAVKLFAQINNEYKSMEDIYMLFDDKLDARLQSLKVSYDSSIHYFDQYLELTKAYPLQKYKQKYHIKPVRIYRIDGLITGLNFLASDVEFWDYTKWVNEVRETYNGEITGLKEKLAQNESKIDETIRLIETGSEATIKVQKPDKDVAFKLNNYDRNSLALALLDYKTFKQNWLLKSKNVNKDTLTDSRLLLYSELIHLNRNADTLCTKVKQVINPVSIKKHNSFLGKYYGGESGLNQFVTTERTLIDNSFVQYQEVLRKNLSKVVAPVQTTLSAKIGGLDIPLYVSKKPVNQLDNTAALTLKQIKNPDGSQYIAGIHKMNKKTTNVFSYIAKINADGKAAWYKELNIPVDSITVTDTDNFIGDIVATPEGCAVLIKSVRATDQALLNSFVFLSAEKGDVRKIFLKDAAVPRKLIYQESNNTFVIVLKGKADVQDYFTEENLNVISINVLGDLLWRRDIHMAGSVQDIIPVKDGYVLTGNYTIIKDKNNKEYRTRINQSQSNPYLIKLSGRGDVVNIVPIESSKSIVIDRVVKVNDASINLLGYEGALTDSPSTGNLMHFMTSSDLRKICSNF